MPYVPLSNGGFHADTGLGSLLWKTTIFTRYIVELNGSFSIAMLNYWRGMDRDIEPTTFVTNLGKSDNGFMS